MTALILGQDTLEQYFQKTGNENPHPFDKDKKMFLCKQTGKFTIHVWSVKRLIDACEHCAEKNVND